MSEFIQKSTDVAFTVNILLKEEGDLVVAHCLELDIVATGKNLHETQKEIISLICAQVDYAFSNNNLDHLYHPAPPEVWKEFFACKEQMERKYKLEHGFRSAQEENLMLPSWLIAKTCRSGLSCHA